MAPTAAFLVLLALISDPFCFHQNGIIWAPNAPLLTLCRPILVIAACSHILYANNIHNNHKIASLRQAPAITFALKPPPPSPSAQCIQALLPSRTLSSTRNMVPPLLRVSPPPLQQQAQFHTPKTTMQCWPGSKVSLSTPSPDLAPLALDYVPL